MITLQNICPDNVLIFKSTRLRALQESPASFGSTYAKESQLSDEEWLQRSHRWCSAGSIGYIAFDQDGPRGLVACYSEEQDPPSGHVISMWVDPDARRSGVGKALIEALKAWGGTHGLHQLRLMVTSVNSGAIRFYERLGFRMTGRTEPYPNDPAIIEYEMILPLRA